MKKQRYAKKIVAIISILCLIPQNVFAQTNESAISSEGNTSSVVVNEICAKNTTVPASDGNCYDWIELYNPSGYSVDLSGYGLSDNENKPYKFTFPEGTMIENGQYLLVYCDADQAALNGELATSFGLSTDGETVVLTDGNGNRMDLVTFGQMDADVSYGRIPDGADTFAYLETTPGQTNTASGSVKVDIEAPKFSKDSGFYDEAFQLEIEAKDGYSIRYTLDGSTPTIESEIYSGSLKIEDVSASANVLSARTDIAPDVTAPTNPVDKATVIKAAAFDEQGTMGEVATATYFVGYNNRDSYYQNQKVISIVTDSDNLYGYDTGIYVLGKTYDDWKNSSEYSSSTPDWEVPGNYMQSGKEWEREATMQIFENGELAVSQNMGIRIHGGASRSLTQKSFNIYARSEYGTSKLQFDLFSGNVKNQYNAKAITEFDSFILRNAGNDAQYSRFRDKLNQSLVSDRNLTVQGMESCIVFIDGEYWGQYEITEKISDDFIESHYGIDKKDVCVIKNEQLEDGEDETYVEYQELHNWIQTTDFSENANYELLCEKVDMQSFADYISAEVYFNNWDWGANNMAMWKAIKEDETNIYADGKWRFILFDTEYSTSLYGMNGPTTNSFSQFMKTESFLADLFNGAMKNETFKKQFCLTFLDMANSNFDSDKTTALITEFATAYHDVTIDTYNRFWPNWPGGWWAEKIYNDEVSAIKTFYNSRFSSITSYLKTTAGLTGTFANLTVKNEDACGSIRLNTIMPEMVEGSWSGKYYTDYPVTLTAEPKEGYRFAYWETSTGEKIENISTELTFNGDITVTAVYQEDNGEETTEVSTTEEINTEISTTEEQTTEVPTTEERTTEAPTTEEKIPVTDVILTEEMVTLSEGESKTLTAIVIPLNATQNTVLWTSDNEEIATIDYKGTVTAKKPGETVITVMTVDGEKTATCKVIVKEETTKEPTTEETTTEEQTTEIATTEGITTEERNTEETTTEDNTTEVVTTEGKTTEDNTTEVVTTEGTTTEDNTTEEVTDVAVTGVTVTPAKVTLTAGESKQLTATVTPANATNKAITFRSSNVKVAKVDANGKVTAVAPGVAVITATAEGNLTKSVTVQVKPGKVTSVKRKVYSSGKVKLTWKKQKGVTGYEIYRYDTKTKKYKLYKKTKKNTITLKKLKSGATHKFRIKAYKKSGSTVIRGNYSNWIRIKK